MILGYRKNKNILYIKSVIIYNILFYGFIAYLGVFFNLKEFNTLTIGLLLYFPMYLFVISKPLKNIFNQKDAHVGTLDFFMKSLDIKENHFIYKYFKYAFSFERFETEVVAIFMPSIMIAMTVFVLSKLITPYIFLLSLFILFSCLVSLFINNSSLDIEKVSASELENFDKLENLNTDEKRFFKEECKKKIDKKGMITKKDIYEIYKILNEKYLRRIKKEKVEQESKTYEVFLKS